MGDAAHLATPMLGMGCSLALEDALELGRAVGEAPFLLSRVEQGGRQRGGW